MALPKRFGEARLKARTRLAVAFAFTPAMAALSGCESGDRPRSQDVNDAAPLDGGAACPAPEDTSGPTVSFENDLMPFFSVTCAFGGCHDGLTRKNGLYLGPNFNDGAADATTRGEVLQSLLAPATTTADLPRVTPGDPSRSFLMLKVQGCQNRLGLACNSALPDEPCGAQMPALSPPLTAEKRSLLARWIAQGAHA
jgi:hypothetical protein